MQAIRQYLERRRWMKDPAARKEMEYLKRLAAGETTTFLVEFKDDPGKSAIHRKGGGQIIFADREVAQHWVRDFPDRMVVVEKRFSDIQFCTKDACFVLVGEKADGPPQVRFALRWNGAILGPGHTLRKYIEL